MLYNPLMENKTINQIISEKQKMNRVNKVTEDFFRSEFKRDPLLVSRDKKSRIIIFSRVPGIKDGVQLQIHILCKDAHGFATLPVVGIIKINENSNKDLVIESLSISKEAQNNGIGKLALQYIENIAAMGSHNQILVNSPVNKTLLNSENNNLESENLSQDNESVEFFDKNLYLFASCGYETDWKRGNEVEGTIPLKKTNPTSKVIKHGIADSPIKISPNDNAFAITEYHEAFNASENNETLTEKFDSLSNLTPVIVYPDNKSIQEFEKFLKYEKDRPLLKIRFK